MQAMAVRKFGVNFMQMINAGLMPKFSTGGTVGSNTVNGNPVGSAPNIKIEVHNETGTQTDAEVGEMKFDGESWVMGLWLRGVAKNTMGARDLMKGMR